MIISPFMLYPCWLPTQEAFLLLLQEEREGVGKSQKGKAMICIMKCPGLWMKCVKHFFLKASMMKMPRTEKVSLKIQSISASSFKFKARGRKCFATIHYRFAVIHRDDRQCPREHRASHRLQTNVFALGFKWFMPLLL